MKVRQKQCTEKKMAPILESENLEDGTTDEFVKDRIKLNTQLISFEHIPEYVAAEILKLYDIKPKGNKMSLYQYLASKKCSLLMEDIDKF